MRGVPSCERLRLCPLYSSCHDADRCNPQYYWSVVAATQKVSIAAADLKLVAVNHQLLAPLYAVRSCTGCHAATWGDWLSIPRIRPYRRGLYAAPQAKLAHGHQDTFMVTYDVQCAPDPCAAVQSDDKARARRRSYLARDFSSPGKRDPGWRRCCSCSESAWTIHRRAASGPGWGQARRAPGAAPG